MNFLIFFFFVAVIFGFLWWTGKLDRVTAFLGAVGVAAVNQWEWFVSLFQ